MGVVYNSNQVKYGDRGYLDAKMQPVANLAALPNDITEVFEGMTVVVLDDGSGKPHDYWRVNGVWVKKDSDGGAVVEELSERVDTLSGSVSTLQASYDELALTVSGKVDQEAGKGLSTNDFSDELKNKLEGIEEGAQANVKANWNESDENSDAYIQNKPDLSQFISSEDLENYYTKSEVYNKEEIRSELDDAIDAAADYTDEVTSGITEQIAGALDEAKAYADNAVADSAQETLDAATSYADSAVTVAKQEVLDEAKEYADEKSEDLAGAGLAYNEGKLDVQVDGTSIVVNGEGRLHVIGGGSGSTQYEAGDYIKIEDDVISVTGITPDEYATKDELVEAMSSVTDTYATKEVLEAESARATSAETELSSRVGNVEAELQEFEEAQTAIADALDEEINRAQSAETNIREAVVDIEEKLFGFDDQEGSVKTYVDNSISEALVSIYKVKGSVETYAELPVENVSEGDVYNVETETTIDGKKYPAGTNWVWVLDESKPEGGYWDPLGGSFDMEPLNEEIQRAISAETMLGERIDVVEGELDGLSESLSSETEARIAKDEELEDAISDESERALTAEGLLSDAISQEKDRAEEAEHAINVEIDDISDAVSELSEKVENITSASTEAIEEAKEEAIAESKEYVDGKNFANNDDVEAAFAEMADAIASAETEAKAYADDKVENLAGDALSYENNKLNVKVDGDSIVINEDGELHVIGDSQDVAKKADKVENAVEGNLAGLNAEGNLTDSGINPEDLTTMSAVTEAIETAIEDEVARAEAAYLKQDALEGYATEEYVNSAVTGMATQEWVNEQDFAKEEDILEAVSAMTEYVDESVNDARVGAIIAATAWTTNQGYAKEEDVIDTFNDVVGMISSAKTEAISASTEYADEIVGEATLDAIQREQAIVASAMSVVNDEVERATSAETELSEAINGEIERATGVEEELRDDLDAEIARTSESIEKLQEDLEDESDRAKLVEDDLEDMIEAESARALSAETEIMDSISGFSVAIAAEEARAMGVEAEIYSSVTEVRSSLESEIDRAISAETALGDAIIEETNRASSAETALENTIQDEIERAISAETALAEAISGISASAVLSESLTSNRSVGGVSAGTEFSAGTSLEEIIRMILTGNPEPVTGDTGNTGYFYYGSVRVADLDPEDVDGGDAMVFYDSQSITAEKVVQYMTRSSSPATADTSVEISVPNSTVAILVAYPKDTFMVQSIVDGMGGLQKPAFDIEADITINGVLYHVLDYFSDAGIDNIPGSKMIATLVKL